MDKLEQYLDQVCRGIGGPRSLRQHVRQELREHLQDAAAEHQGGRAVGGGRRWTGAGGLRRAGGGAVGAGGDARAPPMAVVIDKAMQWKERTMRAKWLWATWAYLAVAGVIVLEVLCFTFATWFLVPKFLQDHAGRVVDPVILTAGMAWLPRSCGPEVGGGRRDMVLLAAVGWGLFEWRVRSENKPFMRLSALGTVALGLLVVGDPRRGSLVIPFCLGMPATGRIARPFAVQQVASIDTSVGALEQALAKQDWEVMQEHANLASRALARLEERGRRSTL